ncbi:MAG: alanine racemase [candidate division KSB1 bacterium]|nr:alanine racemase [candidate division KSB1 bacterium]MDZ7273944.1 alanine racemase [candidate division KSB1 bacterium]MDZ7286100.1 alanine racemase [candidate division KSB1 bacterium]MDZ7299132.1 alanine racemase [candidate division KSB1 bacterium]MDZ7306679.1 alanine racemase [candidate division KSB1 bacterium]
MDFRIPGQAPYLLQNPEALATPRLLVFRDRVQRNLARMRQYLEALAPASGYRHLCPHIKTNKSSLITGWMRAAGITHFKATMRELEMAIEAGVQSVFLAYPLLLHEARHVAQCLKRFPHLDIQVQIGNRAHAEILTAVAQAEQVGWRYFIDLDIGMHRTGIAPAEALALYAQTAGRPHFAFAGLHGYDGHVHQAAFAERRAAAQEAMAGLLAAYRAFRAAGVHVPRIIVAGSPAFRLDLEILLPAVASETLVQASPGTWIFWDSNYEALAPGEFELAALILAQVIEVGPGRLTLNLGHKRWAAESGPLELFSRPGLRVVSFSEEHTVLRQEGSETIAIGDYLLLAPRHVCPTVNLFEAFTVIGPQGEIEILDAPVDGRNR